MCFLVAQISTYYFEKLINFFKSQAWVLYAVIVIVAAIGLTYGAHVLYQHFSNKWRSKEYLLAKILMKAIYWPVLIFIWIEAISINSKLFISHLDNPIFSNIGKLRKVTLLILLAWIFIRFIKLFEEQLLEGRFRRHATDKTTIQATGKILRVAAFIIICLLLLPTLGIEITGIVTLVGGGSAIILGIGAQSILANYFGGIVVHSDGHFRVGDWIYSPDKEIEGIVEYIGWRSTHIRTFDRRMLYVPNASFSTIIVINASRMTNRRIKDDINIRYTDASILPKILEEINVMLQAHPDLDKTRRLAAHFTEFGPYSIKLNIYAFTNTVDWQYYRDIQQRLFLDIIKIITDNGAQIALPPCVALEKEQKKN
jgi:MscS family membrane protein